MRPRMEALGTDNEDGSGLVCRWRLRAHSEDTDRRFVLFASPSDTLRAVAEHARDIHTRLYGDSPAFGLVRDSTGSDLCLDYRVAHTLSPDAAIYLASSPAAFHTELPVQDKLQQQQQTQHPLFLFTASPQPQTKTKTKSPSQHSHSQSQQQQPQSQSQSQQQQQTEQQSGRKRGRPRKTDTPAKANPSHSGSGSETETETENENENENEGSQNSQAVDANYPQKGAAQSKTVVGRRSSPRLFVSPDGVQGRDTDNDRYAEKVKEKDKGREKGGRDKEKAQVYDQPKVNVKAEPVQAETRPIPLLVARDVKKKRNSAEEAVNATADSDIRPATPDTRAETDAEPTPKRRGRGPAKKK